MAGTRITAYFARVLTIAVGSLMNTASSHEPSLVNPYKKQLTDIQSIWARTGKGKNLYGVERWALLTLSAFLMLMPTMLLRWLAGLRGVHARKVAIDIYATAKAALMVLILQRHLWPYRWAPVVASLFLIDLFAYLLGVVLLRDFWHRVFSFTRSLLLLAINLVEFSSAFAVLYLYSQVLVSNGSTVTDWPSALYFSVVTMATVGYGDIVPLPGLGRTLVVVQIAASLTLFAVVLSYFVANVEKKRVPVRPSGKPRKQGRDGT